MKRIVYVTAFVLGLLASVAVPAYGAKPIPASATVSIDNPAPAYGDYIVLSADIDFGSSDDPAQIRTVCTHAGGQSFSFSGIDHSDLTDRIGLYAPNWSSGAATCVANVELLRINGNTGLTQKRTVIGSLTFEVAA